MIYIIIPVHNRSAFTRLCLISLHQQTCRDFKVVIVDDGSSDNTQTMLRSEFPEVIILKADGNYWWTRSINNGVKYALRKGADHILTLNNDLIVKDNYIKEIAKLSYSRNIIGSISCNINDPEEITFSGIKWNPITAKYKPINLSDQTECEQYQSDLLPGRGTLIPSSAFEKVGLFDEKNFPQYLADEDFSLRCKKQGYELILSPHVKVYSHIDETGYNFRDKFQIRSSINYFFSIKSAVNLKRRFLWAKKHGKIPFLYFVLDLSRILISFLRAWFLKK